MPTIEERKAISLGGKSLLVVLPKPWVDYYGVKAGDILELVTNGVLKVRPKRKSRRR
jgi:bifunctional DNA-binding transcriptional regulator/antitoxin component of YhaV-PrlF toxin-antitoxin module